MPQPTRQKRVCFVDKSFVVGGKEGDIFVERERDIRGLFFRSSAAARPIKTLRALCYCICCCIWSLSLFLSLKLSLSV
jgi:hypothetical protein